MPRVSFPGIFMFEGIFEKDEKLTDLVVNLKTCSNLKNNIPDFVKYKDVSEQS